MVQEHEHIVPAATGHRLGIGAREEHVIARPASQRGRATRGQGGAVECVIGGGPGTRQGLIAGIGVQLRTARGRADEVDGTTARSEDGCLTDAAGDRGIVALIGGELNAPRANGDVFGAADSPDDRRDARTADEVQRPIVRGENQRIVGRLNGFRAGSSEDRVVRPGDGHIQRASASIHLAVRSAQRDGRGGFAQEGDDAVVALVDCCQRATGGITEQEGGAAIQRHVGWARTDRDRVVAARRDGGERARTAEDLRAVAADRHVDGGVGTAGYEGEVGEVDNL